MNTNKPYETWYDKSVDQVEKRFGTSRGKGHTRESAAKARREYGPNTVYKTPSGISAKKLIPTDFSALLLLAAVLLAEVFEVPIASSAILIMLIVNYGVALFTYFKALRVLDGMTSYSLPTAKVQRNGRPALIDMRALVPGDVIFLSAGDIVPADCRLFMSDGLYINEGTLTGIQSSMQKDARYENYSSQLPLDRMANMAFATTIVTAGSGRAIVVATGDNTAAKRLGKVKSLITHENLKILSTLKKYCFYWSISMIALVFVITLASLFISSQSGVFDVFLTGISLAAAAMSELYIAFGYIIVGCGIFSAMKRRRDFNEGAIIKNAEKLEELKNITTLIIPKDGIITEPHSVVEKVYSSRTLFSITDTDRVSKFRATVLSGVISTGIYGSGLTTLTENSRRITPEEEAIISAAEELFLYNSNIDRMHPIIEHMGTGGSSKFETTLTVDSDNRYMAVCRGDAESILKACEYYTENGRILRMTTDDRLEFLGAATNLTRNSYRVVAVATGVTGYNNLQRIGSIQSDLTFEGLIAMREPLQPNIAHTVERCKNAGIKVIMTTERYAENDKYLAMSIGIIENEKNILTAAKYDSMKPDVLRTNLPLYSMYTGISSARLSTVIKMLRADGERVGLLAGGINGAILLKKADVGFAQSTTLSPKAKRSGIDLRSRRTSAYSSIAGGSTFDCEALKFISDVVISDTAENGKGGFSAVVGALEYARTIYKNLLRMVGYLTTTQLARIFIVFASLIMGITSLTPIQLIFGGLMIDLAAILSSAFSRPPNTSLSLRDNAQQTIEKPFGMLTRTFVFALFQAITVLAAYPILRRLGVEFTTEQFTTFAFISYMLCQLVTFAELATERSLFRSGLRMSLGFALFIGGVTAFIAAGLALPEFGGIFDIVRLPLAFIPAIAAVTLLTLGTNEIYKLINRQDKPKATEPADSTDDFE